MPKRPDGEDWYRTLPAFVVSHVPLFTVLWMFFPPRRVVHLVCTGSEAVDLAIQMARVYTGRNETIGLHKGSSSAWPGEGL